MRRHLLVFLIILITACENTTYARSDILAWAKQIAALQKKLISLAQRTEPFVQHGPTKNDCNQLLDISYRSKDLYNEIIKLDYPDEARSVHNEFIESYAKHSDADRDYAFYVCQNDVSYYDKYSTALKEANRLNETAYHHFLDLTIQYSISCDEIDLCKGSTSSTIIPPTSPPTSYPCLSWDQITASMKGQQVCVYGIVARTEGCDVFVPNTIGGCRIRFDDRRAFFFASGSYAFPGVSTGDCVFAEGMILLSSEGIPYIDIYDTLYNCP